MHGRKIGIKTPQREIKDYLPEEPVNGLSCGGFMKGGVFIVRYRLICGPCVKPIPEFFVFPYFFDKRLMDMRRNGFYCFGQAMDKERGINVYKVAMPVTLDYRQVVKYLA